MTTPLVGLLTACALIAAAPERPNVLFFAIDDLRPELACYGAADMVTPNIDKLATSGMLFERAYCQQSVCNPSRASVLTGCRPATTKVIANNVWFRKTMPNVVTLPQHFKDNGYHVTSMGKIFHVEGDVLEDSLSWSEPTFPKPKGTKPWYLPESLEVIKNRPAELAAAGKPINAKAARRGPPFEAADQPDSSYSDAGIAEHAIETLGKLKDKPFFMAVGFQKPHLPFNCPKKYFDMYPAAKTKLPANLFRPSGAPDAALPDPYELRSYGTVPLSGPPVSEEMGLNLIRGYKACTSFMDAQVGRVLDELDRLGLREKTIVVFWGDHGYHLGENDHWTKMTNFELGVRVPLIIRRPGDKAGQRTKGLVELVDLYPTLAEICWLPLPGHLEGTSMAPLLSTPDASWKPAAFSDYTRPGGTLGRSIRTEQHRYTEWTDAKGASLGKELYDHAADPAENVNVVDKPDQQETVARLAKQLAAGWQSAKPSKPSSN